jgi:hypothetical protein
VIKDSKRPPGCRPSQEHGHRRCPTRMTRDEAKAEPSGRSADFSRRDQAVRGLPCRQRQTLLFVGSLNPVTPPRPLAHPSKPQMQPLISASRASPGNPPPKFPDRRIQPTRKSLQLNDFRSESAPSKGQ